MRKRIISIMVLLIVGIVPCLGDQRVSRRDFGFGAMEIFQFKNDTSYLTIRDMNQDNLDDILFLDNKVSRLEVLIRLPSTSSQQEFPRLDERFINKGFVLDQWTKTFQVADVNGDQRPDIVSIGDQLGLVIHIQETDGSFGEAVSQLIKGVTDLVTLAIADLDGDTHMDILICRKEDAEILWNSGTGEFKTHTPLDFSASGCQAAITADINGDHRQDLLFYFGSKIGSLRVRMGIGKGEFGWEETLVLPPIRALKKVKPGGEESSDQLAVLLKNGIILRLYGFNQKKQGHLLDQVAVLPQRLPLLGVGRKEAPTWLAADFNKDGYSDFCVAAPLLSQVHLYMGASSGLQPIPRRFDSLTSIKTMKRTASGDLVVFSAAEKAIALHQAKNPERFPLFFKVTGKPLAMAVGQPSTVFAIFKDKGFQLQVFDSKNPGSGPLQTHDLSIVNAPQEIEVVPLGGKNHWMIILFMAYERPVVYRVLGEKLSSLQPDHFRAMSLALEAKAVNVVGSASNPRVLVSEGRVARLYQWQEGKFQVKGQLNPGRKSARLSVACRFSDQQKRPGYMAYDEANQDLVWFSALGKKRPIPIHFREGLKDIVGLAPLRLKDRTGLLLVGVSEVQWLQEKGSALSLKIIGEYTSRGEKVSLWAVVPVMLGSPGKKMLAMLDSNNRSVELVGIRGQELVGELVFEVFQDPGFHEAVAVYEPHAVGTGDINGDNIRDMAVLVHDKLIIYLGE
ncbi:MAG: VCBS repeat-containing protein [Candidatus Aminicenantes bacterium]|nr:MAG: VCBS repeat-containing protein [Candidatus Aminicenantes bacterium]